MLIAEEILVICLNDSSGKRPIGRGQLMPALAGALVAELALLGRITLTPDSVGLLRRRRVVLHDATLTGDALLDQTLTTIAEKPDQKINSLIHAMSTGREGTRLYRQLVDRLVSAGTITEPDPKAFGRRSARRSATTGGGPEQPIRRRVQRAVSERDDPDWRTLVLIMLLHASGALLHLLVHPELDRRLLNKRARDLVRAGAHRIHVPLVRRVHAAVSRAVTRARTSTDEA
ncbi:GPP34 family phosphoprotein [Microlunatus sp. GCM10028923]|uniref:GOLPH3/VPS74 family protein n=1 Tax=Microlunatus sp. GCM10028923 TaxID=3273400 RepID=UPI00361CE28A